MTAPRGYLRGGLPLAAVLAASSAADNELLLLLLLPVLAMTLSMD